MVIQTGFQLVEINEQVEETDGYVQETYGNIWEAIRFHVFSGGLGWFTVVEIIDNVCETFGNIWKPIGRRVV